MLSSNKSHFYKIASWKVGLILQGKYSETLILIKDGSFLTEISSDKVVTERVCVVGFYTSRIETKFRKLC